MKILGIETSCDETAAAVVENGTKILSNIVATSADFHAKTGGIIPEQAARKQIKSAVPVISEAISEALAIKPSNHATKNSIDKWLNGQIVKNIDAIAVTIGPGLIGSLLVGVEAAKVLSYAWNKPIVPINHLVAHIYANWLTPNSKLKIPSGSETLGSRGQNLKLPQFPAIALVVSGGHTDLVLMKGHPLTPSFSRRSGQVENIKWIGGTRDDAAGEAFDKTARLLGLTYPGGPAISAAAEKYLSKNPSAKLDLFPRPMMNNFSAKSRKHLDGPAPKPHGTLGWDFSFSGLKTAVLRKVKEYKGKRVKVDTHHLSAEIQEAIVDVLVKKSLRAIKEYKPKSFLLAGGVAANSRLREKFKFEIRNSKLEIDFYVPPPNLCTDNAAYIASYAYFNSSPIPWKKIEANPALTIADKL